MVQLLSKGSEKSYLTSAHCKNTVYRIMVGGAGKAGSVLDRKYGTVIN